MTSKYTHLLEQIKKLLEKYDETLQEFLHHEMHHTSEKDKAHLHHLLNNLRAELTHLEDIKNPHTENLSEQKAHFLEHHLAAASRITAHWYHIHHHPILTVEEREALEKAEVCEELISLRNHILHLQNEVTQADLEEIETHEISLEPPSPKPHPHHHNAKKPSDDTK